VGAIVCGTSALSEDRFLELLRYFATHSLSEFPYDQIRTVGMGLFRTGRIIQPRALDDNAIQNPKVRSMWTESLIAAFATVVDYRNPNCSPLSYECQGCMTLKGSNCCLDPYCKHYDDDANTIARGIAPEGYIAELQAQYAPAEQFEY
jgi:hypothetical protein